MTGEQKADPDNRRDSTLSAILPVTNLNSVNSGPNVIIAEELANATIEETTNNRNSSTASLTSLPAITTQTNSVSQQDLSTGDMQSGGGHHRLFPSLRFIERRAQRNWRENINNVFQEIRPLVQSSHNSTSNSILASLIPHSRNINSISSNNNNNFRLSANQGNQEINASTDSIVINMNMDQSPSTSTISREIPVNSAIASNGSFVISNNPNASYERQNSGNFIVSSHSQSQISLNDPHGRSQSLHSPANVSIGNGTATENAGIPINNVNNASNNQIPNQNASPGDGGDSVPESLTQIPEAREFINTLCRYTPYVAILFVKSCYDHLDGILYIFALFVTFVHSNFVIRQEASKQVSEFIAL